MFLKSFFAYHLYKLYDEYLFLEQLKSIPVNYFVFFYFIFRKDLIKCEFSKKKHIFFSRKWNSIDFLYVKYNFQNFKDHWIKLLY